MVDESDCIDALRDAARELGASPTKAEYEELGASPTKAEYEELGLAPASATIIRTIGGWNDAKERAGLSTNASTGSRVGPPPAGVDEEIRERWAELSVDQRWHYRNREWNTERTLNRRAELQSWVDERSANAGCARCDESDPACLDFHHRDPDEKSRSVSRLIVDGVSRERLREEMEKCTVLCANCHRKQHTDEPQILSDDRPSVPLKGAQPSTRAQRRAWVDRYKRERGCRRCDHDITAALDLHHVEEATKENAVSRLVSDGAGFDRIRAEVRKCVVLCANCHRKEHDGES